MSPAVFSTETKFSNDGALHELTCCEAWHETLHVKRVTFFEWKLTIGEKKRIVLKLTSASPIVPEFSAGQ